jgi:2-oxoglutarate ferredoxin oxidoreductase subunit alpha
MKFESAREKLPLPIYCRNEGARIGLIAMGSTEQAVTEAQDKLLAKGLPTDFMRIRALPMAEEVGTFIREHDRNYVIELNRDGQLHQILAIEYCDLTDSMISLAYIDGLPMTAEYIIKGVLEREEA